MNKTEAAEFLGVKPRTLESYATSGRLKVRYVRGKTRDVADYDADELARLKAEMETPTERVNEPREKVQNTQLARFSDVAQPGVGAGATEGARAFVLALMDSLGVSVPDHATGAASVPIADKKLLTLPEAAALTGLSRGALQAAIKAGELPAQIMGRSWKVRPIDLDAWIDGQFQTKATPQTMGKKGGHKVTTRNIAEPRLRDFRRVK